MKIFKDKKGNKLSYKEFISKWKSGIEEITPLQKLKTQLTGTRIMLLGLFLGLLISIYGWKNLWWVGIILLGALLNTGVQYLSIKQQKKILDDLEKQFKEPEEEPKEVKPIILDNNPISIAGYADEFPENFEEISKSLDKEKEVKNNGLGGYN